ncbi:hypothetical protein ACWEPC_06710 [Nonomuraea sp. NPDC004297]
MHRLLLVPAVTALAGPYDPALARPSVLEWQDPYNSGANTR